MWCFVFTNIVIFSSVYLGPRFTPTSERSSTSPEVAGNAEKKKAKRATEAEAGKAVVTSVLLGKRRIDDLNRVELKTVVVFRPDTTPLNTAKAVPNVAEYKLAAHAALDGEIASFAQSLSATE